VVITNSYLFSGFAILFCGLATGYVLGHGISRKNARSFQNGGEALVRRELQANFGSPDFHLLNHITLKLGDSTTQIDHILVSRFGVFVIETKDYSGWIFANAKHSTWTQVTYSGKFKFQNPIFQNLRHLQAVQELLDFLPPSAIKSVVVFVGSADFKTEVPAEVYSLSGLVEYIRNHSEEALSLNRVQFSVGRLETARLAVSGQTDLEHLQNLERRHGRRK
jgi:Nuclease-related domain